MTVAMTSHFSQISRKRSTFSGSTIAHMRSCDSLMRISSGESEESRSGTVSSSTRIPPEPAEASSEVAQDRPGAAEVLDAGDELLAEDLQGALDEELLLERVADLDGRALRRAWSSSKVSEARTETPPMPSPPVRAP